MKRFTLFIAAAAMVSFAGPASAGLGPQPAIQCVERDVILGTPGQMVSDIVKEEGGAQALAAAAKTSYRNGTVAAWIADSCKINEPIGVEAD